MKYYKGKCASIAHECLYTPEENQHRRQEGLALLCANASKVNDANNDRGNARSAAFQKLVERTIENPPQRPQGGTSTNIDRYSEYLFDGLSAAQWYERFDAAWRITNGDDTKVEKVDTNSFSVRVTEFAGRREANPNRKNRVFPRFGKPRDPGGLIHEGNVRAYWTARMDGFRDYTADGSEAFGADFYGFDRELQRWLFIEAQPVAHDPTDNEYEGVERAEREDAMYIIHTRNKGWFEVTPADFKEVKGHRLMKRPK